MAPSSNVSASHTRFSEVCILGAGPAGATAAMVLSRAGMDCTLIDRAVFPRDKVCGDALSGKVVDTLRKIDPSLAMALGEEHAHLPCWGVQFVAPSGEILEVPFRLDYADRMEAERAPGYIARRTDFDHWLLERALASAAVVQEDAMAGTAGLHPVGDSADGSLARLHWHPNTRIVKTERCTLDDGRPGIALHARDGRIWTTAYCLAADGANGVGKQLGGYRLDPKHHSAAVRAYYTGVQGLHEHHFIELHYLRSVVPGYLWIFPLPDGRANVGLGLRSDQIARRRLDLKKLLQEAIDGHPELRGRFAQAELEGPVRGFGLPLGSKRRTLQGDAFMLLGDAASLIDPFTGEGIGNAMISGRLAAERILALRKEGDASASGSPDSKRGQRLGVPSQALEQPGSIQGSPNRAADLAPYGEAVYRQLGDELKLSYAMQRLAAHPRLFNFVVRKAARNATLRETISCMFEDLDMRERLRKPSFYLKLLFSS
jgi:geranylgeranyl reductase family protein